MRPIGGIKFFKSVFRYKDSIDLPETRHLDHFVLQIKTAHLTSGAARAFKQRPRSKPILKQLKQFTSLVSTLKYGTRKETFFVCNRHSARS